MSVLEIGKALVDAVNQGPAAEAAFVEKYFTADTISIEGQDSDDMPAKIQGIDAIKGKHAWWFDNNTVHGTEAVGPFIGNREDQFVVHFRMDITPTGGERMQMDEVGLFTTSGGKVVQEEFLYLV